MNIKDLRKKTAGELDKELSDKGIALSNFKFGTAGSKSKNVKAGRNLKREMLIYSLQIQTVWHTI